MAGTVRHREDVPGRCTTIPLQSNSSEWHYRGVLLEPSCHISDRQCSLRPLERPHSSTVEGSGQERGLGEKGGG